MSYLGHVEIRLHHEERVQGICPRCVGIVEEVLDLGKCRLPEPRSAILGWELLTVLLLKSKRLGRVGERRDNPCMEGLDFLQSRGKELPLWR